MSQTFRTVAILRVQSFGAPERRALDVLQQVFGDDTIVAGPDRVGMLPDDIGPTLRVSQNLIRQLELTPPDNWAWTCPDVFLHAARRAFPDYDRYWLIDPEVVFHGVAASDFFAAAQWLPQDLLSRRSRPWSSDDPQIDAMAWFDRSAVLCGGTILRVSGRALDALLPERMRYFRQWRADHQATPCANGATFLASMVRHDPDLSDGDMQRSLARFFAPDTDPLRRDGLILSDAVGEFPAGILYPVVDASTFARRLSATGSAGVGDLPRYSDWAATYLDAETAREVSVAAQGVLKARHQGGEAFEHAFITGRRKRYRFDSAAFGDFDTGVATTLPDVDPETVLPYAADYHAMRLMMVDTSRAQVESDPFLYLSQFERARYCVKTRLRHIPVDLGEVAEPDVTFVFSIGRCGSTLVSNLAKAAGVTAYSEPDAVLGLPDFTSPGARPRVERLLRSVVGMLHRHAGRQPIVVKLRTNSNRDIRWFSQCFPRARFVFLSRNLVPWSRSYATVFNWTAEQMLRNLTNAVAAHDHLREIGLLSAFIPYETLISAPHASVERLLGTPLDSKAQDRVADAMAQDSQAGLLRQDDGRQGRADTQLTELKNLLEASPRRDKFRASPLIYT